MPGRGLVGFYSPESNFCGRLFGPEFAYYGRVYELCSHRGTSRGIGCKMQVLKSVFVFACL